MTRIFSFATGNLWRWSNASNREDLLDIIRGIDISGVELTFSSREELYAFDPSETHLQWLKSLNYVSIHAPFSLCNGTFVEVEVVQQLEAISTLYQQLNAKNVIIHPEKEVFTTDLLHQCDFLISTENLPRGFGVSTTDLADILQRFPKMMLCLDAAHAYSFGKQETGKLIELFGDRISQVHLSGTYKKQDHLSLKAVTRDFLFSILPLKTLNVPIVIEEDMDVASLETIIGEVDYIKSLFV